MLWCTPTGLKMTEQQLGVSSSDGADLSAKVLAPGFSEIIERLAKRSRADVRLNTRISSIDRSTSGCKSGTGTAVPSGLSNGPSWLPGTVPVKKAPPPPPPPPT